jgi:hypothetical protein
VDWLGCFPNSTRYITPNTRQRSRILGSWKNWDIGLTRRVLHEVISNPLLESPDVESYAFWLSVVEKGNSSGNACITAETAGIN